MHKNVVGKDLTKEAPRSPRIRVGGYAILGRTLDKCRALVAGNIGEYHFDCPLDNTLFGFKGIKGEDFKAQIEQGASDEEMIEWLNRSGEKKTPAQIKSLERESRSQQSLRRCREARFLRQRDQETWTRSGKDDNVRVARDRRPSLTRAASGVSCWLSLDRWAGCYCLSQCITP